MKTWNEVVLAAMESRGLQENWNEKKDGEKRLQILYNSTCVVINLRNDS